MVSVHEHRQGMQSSRAFWVMAVGSVSDTLCGLVAHGAAAVVGAIPWWHESKIHPEVNLVVYLLLLVVSWKALAKHTTFRKQKGDGECGQIVWTSCRDCEKFFARGPRLHVVRSDIRPSDQQPNLFIP